MNTHLASSLSRLRQSMLDHDTGLVTAQRSTLTYAENQKRNEQLKALLRSKYNVTKLRGVYVENYASEDAVEVGENVFFVVDHQDTGHLRDDLIRLGDDYDQDSVLFIPQGATGGELIGTNETGWPGRGNVQFLEHPVFGRSGEFMTKVKGRPFVLNMASAEDVVDFPCDYPRGFMGEWGRRAFTGKPPLRQPKHIRHRGRLYRRKP